jgi:protein-disulfide isomerase
MHRQRLLERGITALCAIGLLLNLAILRIHTNLAARDDNYTSLCNVSTRINCDAVLDSAYATLFGLPVAAWGALTYAIMLVLSLVSAARAPRAVLVLAGWSAGYAAVMAAISLGVLRAVCLMCSGLYVVTATLLVLAFRRVQRAAGTLGAVVAGVLPMALALTFGYATTAAIMPQTATMKDVADVRSKEPEFYRWYQELPVVAAAAEVPSGPVHAKGPAAAPVTIVEYSDFACSHCARARRDLERLIAERPSDVRLVFRHFPLDTSCNPTLRHSVHPSACEAAMAAECAGELGKFWEFHDYLFDNSQRPYDYPQAAAALGLDQARFQTCLASGRSRETVARDVAAAASLGVESTPTLFINGRTVRGALDSRLYEAALVIEKNRTDHGGP